MDAIRFKAHIGKERSIKIPESIKISETDVDVIILLGEKNNKNPMRWEKWIKEKVLSGGVIEKWRREEIYE
ncbi:hypothetical protein BPIT_28720 [Candidatus Brocadia pituitae]|nr:hypothetical protein BPIT_28720 [Candidatus Brocadia pituitae]